MNIIDPRQIKACEEDPECNVAYHQPGAAAGYPSFRESNLKSCPEMTSRIRGENPTVSPIHFEGLCPYGTSKIALAVDPSEDYHFWRQDSNGLWSHKPGGTKVTNKDASSRLIYNPKLSDRNFSDESSDLDYTDFCSFYCVPRQSALFMKIGGKRYFIPRAASSSRKAKHRYPLTRHSLDSTKQVPRRNRTYRKETL
jgi:hypothetical protein